MGTLRYVGQPGEGFEDQEGRPTVNGAFYILEDRHDEGVFGVIVEGPFTQAPELPAVQLPPEGARVKFLGPLDRYPHFIVPDGAIGTVVESTEFLFVVRLDVHLPGAEAWENEVSWPWEDFSSVGTDLEVLP